MTAALIPVCDETESRLHLRDLATLTFTRWYRADAAAPLCLATPPDELRRHGHAVTRCLLAAEHAGFAHHAQCVIRGPRPEYVEVQWPMRGVVLPPEPVDAGGLTALERMRKAVADGAGWPWCDEHRRARYDGADPCNHRHPVQPRGHVCVVHGREHPEGWFDECRSEADVAADAERDDAAAGTHVELGLWDRVRAKIRCHRRGAHRWTDDGDTLGGIWLHCADCCQVDEYLPGLHEPHGGEAVWQRRLDEARGRAALIGRPAPGAPR